MATSSWNAGIIRPVAVPPAGPFQDGAAPGVWTLDQVAFWQQQGLWPIAGNAAQAALIAGGVTGGSTVLNVIEKIIANTTGNATDFGDITVSRMYLSGCSNGHGGLQ